MTRRDGSNEFWAAGSRPRTEQQKPRNQKTTSGTEEIRSRGVINPPFGPRGYGIPASGRGRPVYSRTAGRSESEAFRDCLPAEGHSSAAKETRCYPIWQVEQTTSGVGNWPPSDQVFLDLCCQVPGPRPSLKRTVGGRRDRHAERGGKAGGKGEVTDIPAFGANQPSRNALQNAATRTASSPSRSVHAAVWVTAARKRAREGP